MFLSGSDVAPMVVTVALLGLMSGAAVCAESGSAAGHSDSKSQTVAWVSGIPIPRAEFQAALHKASQRTFYHGKIAPERLARLQRDVVNRMIDERLLLEEADRRGITIESAPIEQALAAFRERNQNLKGNSEHQESTLSRLREDLVSRARLRRLEMVVREVGVPTDDDISAFYNEKPEAFTEPERAQVSVILLRVDPSSPAQAWASALSDADKLARRLRAGEPFEAAARLHSADDSADNGGDLGYVHRGMLAEPAQQALDAMKEGEISDAVRVLQGVLILRLNKRVPARLLPFDQVRERAAELWRRQRGSDAWRDLIASLRARTEIALNEVALLPLDGMQPLPLPGPDARTAPDANPQPKSPPGESRAR